MQKNRRIPNIQYCRCFFCSKPLMTSQFRNFTTSRHTKYKPHYHETMMLNQNPCINFFYLFFAFSVPQCPKIEMKKKEPVMIPLFRTRLNQDSFEVFDWTLEIPNQIQKYSRLNLKGFSGYFFLSCRHEEVIKWHFFCQKVGLKENTSFERKMKLMTWDREREKKEAKKSWPWTFKQIFFVKLLFFRTLP